MRSKKTDKIKIVLTGGHAATTGLAVVEELSRRFGKNKSWDIYWIGPKSAIEGTNVPTLASMIMPRAGVTFHSIHSGRVQRKMTKWSIISILKFPVGFIHAFRLLLKIKPKLILSFGGYASFPVVVVGFLMRIPVILHDQTYSFNRSSVVSAPFANKIAVTRRNSLKYYPKDKTIVTGNPIMTQMSKVLPKTKKHTPPTIYITGGSSGAVKLNKMVKEVLPILLHNYTVIHQTGALDYESFTIYKKSLDKKVRVNYEVFSNIDPMKISEIYEKADIIVSRAGANTVSEIIYTKIPSVLVPLVIGKLNEQKKNALFAQQFGIAYLLEEHETSGEDLYQKIKYVDKNWDRIIKRVKHKESPDLEASSKLVNIIESELS